MKHAIPAFRLALPALAAAALALGGCGPRARLARLREGGAAFTNALEKARTAQLAGRVEEARGFFEEIAAARPQDADARLQLGILLQDLANDPYAALGEYRAYLRLAPGSEKEAMVLERARAARNQIARRASSGDAAENASLPGTKEQQRRISELEQALADARAEAELAIAERDKAKSEADRLQREVLAKDRQLDFFQTQGVTAAPRNDLSRAAEETFVPETASAAEPENGPPPLPSGPRTYKVKRGDTLWSVAQKAYGDASRTGDIRDANRDRLGGSDKLVEGMVLVLPY